MSIWSCSTILIKVRMMDVGLDPIPFQGLAPSPITIAPDECTCMCSFILLINPIRRVPCMGLPADVLCLWASPSVILVMARTLIGWVCGQIWGHPANTLPARGSVHHYFLLYSLPFIVQWSLKLNLLCDSWSWCSVHFLLNLSSILITILL